jgi:hypothetical protein
MKKRATKTASKAVRKSAKAGVSETRLIDVPTDVAGLQKAIQILGDATQPEGLRGEAMQGIQAASFGLLEFDAVRADYIATLRGVAQDASIELRQRALGILSRENDSYAQKVLVEGLKDAKKSLLPAEKALQLLSYNPHAGVYASARQLFASSTDGKVKQAALRLMSGDPESAKIIEKTLASKVEAPEIRRMAAAALQTLAPKSLQDWASKAVIDKTENQEIVATCLTAMQQFGDTKAIVGNKPLRKRLKEMSSESSTKVKQLAKQFMAKYEL